MTTSAITPELSAALNGIPGFEHYSQPPIASSAITPELSAALNGIPGFEHYSNPTSPSTSRGKFAQTLSAAGHRVGEVLSEAADFGKKNADFLSGLIAGGAVSFGVAAGLHRPDLAISFPMLYSILGETIPRALVGVYQGIEHIEKSRLGRPLIGIGDRGIGKEFTAEKYNKLQSGVVRRVMNGLTNTLANKTYHKIMAGVLIGGVTGAVAGGVLEFSHQIHVAQAHQPAAVSPPVSEQQNLDAMKNSNYHRASSNAPWRPTVQPAQPPAQSLSDEAYFQEMQDMSNQPPPPTSVLPAPPTLQETVSNLSPQVNMLALRNDPSLAGLDHDPWYWNAAEKWIEPIAKQMGLSHQAQLYLTDAVTDVIKNQGPVGQVQNMKFDLAKIANHILDGVGRNGVPGADMKHVSAGQVSELLKGIKVTDLTQIGQAAELMLKKATGG